MPGHTNLKLPGQFSALIDMKLHAQNQLYSSIKVLKTTLGKPEDA